MIKTVNYYVGDLIISDASDNNLYIVQKKNKGTAVRMGMREISFLLDILQFPREVCGLDQELLMTFPEFGESEKDMLMEHFNKWGFVKNSEIENTTKSKFFSLKKLSNIKTIKLFSINLDKLFSNKIALIKILLNTITVVCSLLLLFTSIMLFSFIAPELQSSMTVDLIKTTNFIVLVIMQLITMFLHELFHGIACKYYGGRVPEIGCMLYYLFPVMYCNTNDVYTFSSRRKKIKVALAGIYINLVLSGISLFSFTILWRQDVIVYTLLVYSALNIGVSVYNLIPFIKYDGYWVLSAALNMTNMIDKTFTLFLSAVLSFSNYRRVKIKPIKKIILTTFGFISSVFDIIFWVYSLVSVQKFLFSILHNATYIILFLLAVYVIQSVLKRWIKEIKDILANRTKVLNIKFY